MRKRQTFADIFALCSNLLAYVYEKRIVRWREAVNLFSRKNAKELFWPGKEKKHMKIAVACDHGGLNLKKALIEYLVKNGYEYVDFGTNSTDSCDYPDYALPAAESVANGECDRGIVICSTGIGVSIVANKVPGVRCAHCHDTYCAKYTRYHNDANMLAFGEKCLGTGMMEEIVTAFLTGEYMGGERHDRRVAKIKAIEEKYSKK